MGCEDFIAILCGLVASTRGGIMCIIFSEVFYPLLWHVVIVTVHVNTAWLSWGVVRCVCDIFKFWQMLIWKSHCQSD